MPTALGQSQASDCETYTTIHLQQVQYDKRIDYEKNNRLFQDLTLACNTFFFIRWKGTAWIKWKKMSFSVYIAGVSWPQDSELERTFQWKTVGVNENSDNYPHV